MIGLLKGKKTYVTAVIAILTVVGGMLTGEVTMAAGLQAVLTAVLGVTLRNGMK